MKKIVELSPTQQEQQGAHQKLAYPEINAQIRREVTQRLIRQQSDLMQNFPERIDVSDTEAVKQVAVAYENYCAENCVCPSFMGFCGALGISRKWAYEFVRLHPESPTAALFDRLRTNWAALRISLAETGAISEATAIFILKNSGHGLTDRQEIVLEPQQMTPLSSLEDTESARKRIMAAIPVDDDTDGGGFNDL